MKKILLSILVLIMVLAIMPNIVVATDDVITDTIGPKQSLSIIVECISEESLNVDYQTDELTNIYVMDYCQLQNYQAGVQFAYFPNLSKMETTSGNVQGTLQSGKYVVCFENPSWTKSTNISVNIRTNPLGQGSTNELKWDVIIGIIGIASIVVLILVYFIIRKVPEISETVEKDKHTEKNIILAIPGTLECHRCMTSNDSDSVYCKKCGERLR